MARSRRNRPAASVDDLQLVVFGIPLPYAPPLPVAWTNTLVDTRTPVPVLDGIRLRGEVGKETFSLALSGCMFVRLVFLRFGAPEAEGWITDWMSEQALRAERSLPISPTAVQTSDSMRWVANALTPLNALPSSNPIDDAFERCFKDLSRVWDAVRLTTSTILPGIERESLPRRVSYAVRSARVEPDVPHLPAVLPTGSRVIVTTVPKRLSQCSCREPTGRFRSK
jgi:hypothetical protein